MEVNGVRDVSGSVSLRAEETESGFRFFLDEDEESFFDLNLDRTLARDEFEFQIAFPQLAAAAPPIQRSAEALFRSGRILPLQWAAVPDSEVQVDTVGKAPRPRGSEELLRHGDRQPPDSDEHCHSSTDLRRTESRQTAERTNTGATKFLVRFPSARLRSTLAAVVRPHQLLSPLHERARGDSGKGKLARRLSACLPLGKKKKRSIHSRGAVGAMDADEAAVVNTILDAVDFAVRSGRWARADGRTEAALERHGSINSAIAHCKMSYSSGAGPR